jgi:hypothetical protein
MRVLFRVDGPLLCYLDQLARDRSGRARFTCNVVAPGLDSPSATFPIRPVHIRPLVVLHLDSCPTVCTVAQRTPMPAYCLHDCHYFYRSALRLLNISTSISPLYA